MSVVWKCERANGDCIACDGKRAAAWQWRATIGGWPVHVYPTDVEVVICDECGASLADEWESARERPPS